MRCENCQGFGFVPISVTEPIHWLVRGKQMVRTIYGFPCPVCHGFGVTYCCDEAGANPPNSSKLQGGLT